MTSVHDVTGRPVVRSYRAKGPSVQVPNARFGNFSDALLKRSSIRQFRREVEDRASGDESGRCPHNRRTEREGAICGQSSVGGCPRPPRRVVATPKTAPQGVSTGGKYGVPHLCGIAPTKNTWTKSLFCRLFFLTVWEGGRLLSTNPRFSGGSGLCGQRADWRNRRFGLTIPFYGCI